MFKEIFTRLFAIYLPVWFIAIHCLARSRREYGGPAVLKCALPENGGDAEEELWKTFDTHPEGLNQAEVNLPANNMVKINYPHNNRRRVGTFMGLLSQPL